ncbi:MAG: hypothetical protein H6719_04420 [Sandaracinaceae bacterium]|nr:hypothetical protein [Sandaracinaceae bacterium]
MARPRMRPEFVLAHPRPTAVVAALGEVLESDPHCEGTVLRGHAVVRIREADRHFWSPQLEVDARLPDPSDEYAPEAPELAGRFAPHPHVWTLFMAIYGLIAIGGTAGAMWGLSQWTLGLTPWALAGVPAALFGAAFVYGAVFIGQGLGAEQMYELRSVVDRAAAKASGGDGELADDEIAGG